jgi:hypothetical protein
VTQAAIWSTARILDHSNAVENDISWGQAGLLSFIWVFVRTWDRSSRSKNDFFFRDPPGDRQPGGKKSFLRYSSTGKRSSATVVSRKQESKRGFSSTSMEKAARMTTMAMRGDKKGKRGTDSRESTTS